MQVELSTENKNSKEENCPKQQAQDTWILAIEWQSGHQEMQILKKEHQFSLILVQ